MEEGGRGKERWNYLKLQRRLYWEDKMNFRLIKSQSRSVLRIAIAKNTLVQGK